MQNGWSRTVRACEGCFDGRRKLSSLPTFLPSGPKRLPSSMTRAWGVKIVAVCFVFVGLLRWRHPIRVLLG